MSRTALALLAGFAMLCVAHGAKSVSSVRPMRLSDDRGKAISLAKPASRIITLAPHLAEIVFAVGAGTSLVGVSARSDFPAQAARLPVVSDAGRIDLERIVALQPDLVFAWLSGNPTRQLELLERRGIRVLAVEVRQLEDIPRLLRLVGAAAGRTETAEQAALRSALAVRALKARYAGVRRLRVFVEIWNEPLITVNGAHLISEAMRVCGGDNIFAREAALTPAVSPETLLVAQPEVVIMSSGAGSEAEQVARWRRMALLPAVRNGALYDIDPNMLHRQGPRLLEAARAMCERLDRARSGQGRR